MGKPIITTRVVGRKDVVEDGVGGYLCEPKSVADLDATMNRMLRLPACERIAMGLRGRLKIEREYVKRFVVERYLNPLMGKQYSDKSKPLFMV